MLSKRFGEAYRQACMPATTGTACIGLRVNKSLHPEIDIRPGMKQSERVFRKDFEPPALDKTAPFRQNRQLHDRMSAFIDIREHWSATTMPGALHPDGKPRRCRICQNDGEDGRFTGMHGLDFSWADGQTHQVCECVQHSHAAHAGQEKSQHEAERQAVVDGSNQQ
jgi:hypothetical protein